MSEHTPSPQSVVVCRAELERVRALLAAHVHRNPARTPAHNAHIEVEAMLAAAPAPSSLAGGVSLPERLRFAETWDLDADQSARDRCGVLMLEAAEALERAALSPEAPARVIDAYDKFKAPVGSTVWIRATVTDNCTSCCSVVVDAIHGKMHLTVVPRDVSLTPRHEAPASDEVSKQRDEAIRIAKRLHDTVESLIYGLPKYLNDKAQTDEENMIGKAWHVFDAAAYGLAALPEVEPVQDLHELPQSVHEAPAEVAGEAYASAKAEIETLLMGETFFSFAEASELATDVMEIVSKHFLRARSSAPEARS